MRSAHFFDLDVLINVESSVWLVSKTNPNYPIIKITQSEFNLIKKGIYRKYNCPLEITGKNYWFPENLYNQIKIKCKNLKCNITELAFSMQEFMNPEIIKDLNSKILIHNFQHLRNSDDDIYVICSKNTESNYQKLIEKLEDKLAEFGLKIKKIYHLSKTFYNRDTDYINHKKVRLLLQHIVGFKTNDNLFTDEEIQKYDNVYYYDDEPKSLELVKNANSIFQFLISNTDDENIKSKIKEYLKSFDHIIYMYYVTHNGVNPFNISKVMIDWSNLTKTFEGFRLRFD